MFRIAAIATTAMVTTSAVAALILNAPPAESTVPGYNGKIAFAVNIWNGEDSNTDIFVMEPDGSDITNLTNTPDDHERGPAWSPDGQLIAFERNSNLWIMDEDGSNQIQLTLDDAGADNPTWHPDGTKIAFLGVRGQGDATYMYDFETQEVSFLLEEGGTNVGGEVEWSPDGTRIAYGLADLFVANADGSDPVRLTTNSPGVDANPSWSPDGSRIAFRSNRSFENDIFAIDPNGTGEVNLTQSTLSEGYLSWSPDGSRIAYDASIDLGQGLTDSEIWVMAADGTGQTRLTFLEHQAYSPTGSPSPRSRTPRHSRSLHQPSRRRRLQRKRRQAVTTRPPTSPAGAVLGQSPARRRCRSSSPWRSPRPAWAPSSSPVLRDAARLTPDPPNPLSTPDPRPSTLSTMSTDAPPEARKALLQAIEEFNTWRFYDCHETLEDVWHEAGGKKDGSRYANFYQGLIKAAAGFHHVLRGNHKGAVTLLTDSLRLLTPYSPVALTVDVESLTSSVRGCLESIVELGPERLSEFDRSTIPTITYDAAALSQDEA